MTDDPAAGGETPRWEPATDAPVDGERLVIEPDCRRCPALVADRTRIAWGNGPRDPAVLVVGEAPAAGDPDAVWGGGNHTGCAYTSAHSGRRVRQLFDAIGYGDRACYTNAVRCFPADRSDPGTNREPTAAERAACRGHLRTELSVLEPAAVVPTGKHATRSVLTLADRTDALADGFLDSVLEPIDDTAIAPRIVPILHPSYRDVWLSRLGLDAATYRERLADALAAADG